MNIPEAVKKVQESIITFLSNRPMWAYWIAYTALIAVLFGLVYLIIAILTLQWWIPVIVILAVGMIWGSYSFKQNSGEKE